ncbi:hypothetical protein D1007_00857 [Hordeum vulgare]|nr:hypothetical protein D1007_00857 [Hordeum vulgare]
MAPVRKQKPEAQGPAPAPPLLECALSKDVDLAPVLPWTTTESNERGRTLIFPGAIEEQPTSKDLPTEELSRGMTILLGGDPGDLPEALGLLYRLNDRTDVIAGLPIFDERGLLPVGGSDLVEVSSGDTYSEGDSENTVEDCP